MPATDQTPAQQPALGVDDIVGFLLDRGVLDPGAVLAGVLVDPVPRRNSNLRVATSTGGGLFVKQADGQVEGSARTVRAEGEFYRTWQARPDAARLRLPRLLYVDPARPLVVLELLGDCEPILDYSRAHTAHRFPLHAWRALGGHLGAVHRVLHGEGTDTGPAPLLPWVLNAPEPYVESLANLSPAALTVVEILQGSPVLTDGLLGVRRMWRDEQPIHGDVRADNILVRSGPEGGTEVRLVDWELHRRGDPLWDVAGALDVLALEYLRSVSGDEQAGSNPPLPWAVFQSASRALWQGYLAAAGHRARRPQAEAEVLAAYCAAQLVATAVEGAARAEELPDLLVTALQAAENLFADATGAATRFFGIG